VWIVCINGKCSEDLILGKRQKSVSGAIERNQAALFFLRREIGNVYGENPDVFKAHIRPSPVQYA
jgi:hypothetical protein